MRSDRRLNQNYYPSLVRVMMPVLLVPAAEKVTEKKDKI